MQGDDWILVGISLMQGCFPSAGIGSANQVPRSRALQRLGAVK